MTEDSGENIELSVSDGIATVVLDRPERLNALSNELMQELTGVARRLSGDPAVHAVVLTGRGGSFSAGADMSAGGSFSPSQETLLEQRRTMRIGPDLCAAWEGIEQVTVAAIEGHCIGGGLALAAACDFRIAAAGAAFRLPEVALGINMSWQSLPRLVALTGPARAKRLAIFCEALPAEQAAEWGLVDEVTADGAALETALAWARRVTELPPLPVRMVKEAVNASALAMARATIYMDRDQILLTGQTDDFREGVNAFFAKRRPKFRGN